MLMQGSVNDIFVFAFLWGTCLMTLFAAALGLHAVPDALRLFWSYQKTQRRGQGSNFWKVPGALPLWIHDLRSLLSTGQTLSAALKLAPPPVSLSPQQNTTDFLNAASQNKKTSPWTALCLRLLLFAHEHGSPLLPLLDILKTILDDWKKTENKLKQELRPIVIQIMASLLLPVISFFLTSLWQPNESTSHPIVLSCVGLFSLGLIWILLLVRRFRRRCFQETTLWGVLFPHLICTGAKAGMTVERALSFALEIKGTTTRYSELGMSQLRPFAQHPPQVLAWFPPAWWPLFHQSLLRSADQGTSLVQTLSPLASMWFERWQHQVSLELKTLPYKLLLPVALLIVPAALALIASPFLASSLHI